MTDRELMQQALDALEYASDQTKPENLHGCDCLICTTILALRDRLAQTEQGPVAWMYVNPDCECEQIEYEVPPNDSSVTPLYAAPRPWVGLTDEEIKRIGKLDWDDNYVGLWYDFAKAIEDKLRERNT